MWQVAAPRAQPDALQQLVHPGIARPPRAAPYICSGEAMF
jgi:hypothetical protein